ncbi:hypothetical protein OUZ56_019384 [Daphnia magna]|uniref:Uncharacterized protein n=1 Tax=Daphnia magna TaxID=35525 RepID=A0ABQ9ZBE7_9CRUS|nr:hypothetical protein OUZ56_019384 [Daphnia magna]
MANHKCLIRSMPRFAVSSNARWNQDPLSASLDKFQAYYSTNQIQLFDATVSRFTLIILMMLSCYIAGRQ